MSLQPNEDMYRLSFSSRGKPRLTVDNFNFYLSHISQCGQKTWRCCNNFCTSKVITFGADGMVDTVKSRLVHSHDPHPTRVKPISKNLTSQESATHGGERNIRRFRTNAPSISSSSQQMSPLPSDAEEGNMMDTESETSEEPQDPMIEARNSIQKKFDALRRNERETTNASENTFKPVTNPSNVLLQKAFIDPPYEEADENEDTPHTSRCKRELSEGYPPEVIPKIMKAEGEEDKDVTEEGGDDEEEYEEEEEEEDRNGGEKQEVSLDTVRLQMNNPDNFSYLQQHSYQPYVAAFRNSDEIRIPIHSQDLYTIPGESRLLVEGKVHYLPKLNGAARDDGKTVILGNNAIAYLFEQVRYELNGVEIDRTRNVGITSTAKVLLTHTKDEAAALEIAGWGGPVVDETDKVFRALVPLSVLLGFANDYKEVLIRLKQELVLIRSRTDKNVYTLKEGAEKNAVTLEVTKVRWIMPQVKFNLEPEKAILDQVRRNASFQIGFRSWDTYEYPQLPISNRETWKLMTTSNVEAPSYIILMFQTDRMDEETKDASKFDHVKLRSFKVHLNNVAVPYENLNEDFDRNNFLNFYQNYLNFITDYSNGEKLCEPPLTMNKFKSENPMFVMKCTYEDIIKPGSLDIKIEMEAADNFPPATSVSAILVHDVLYSYQPLSGNVIRTR